MCLLLHVLCGVGKHLLPTSEKTRGVQPESRLLASREKWNDWLCWDSCLEFRVVGTGHSVWDGTPCVVTGVAAAVAKPPKEVDILQNAEVLVQRWHAESTQWGSPRPWVMGKGPCVQCRVPRESRRAGIFHSCVQGPLQFPGRVLAPQSMRAGTKWIHGSAEELSQRCKKHRLSLSLAGCLFPTNMRTLHKNRVSRVSEAGWCVLSLLAW